MIDYVVVDIDNKSAEKEEDEKIIANFENLKKIFVPENTDNIYVEMTGNYGIHIILKNDLDLTGVPKNRWLDMYDGEGYAIDIFVAVNEKRSLLVIAKPHKDNIIAVSG